MGIDAAGEAPAVAERFGAAPRGSEAPRRKLKV
jgi:hypothetical protein